MSAKRDALEHLGTAARNIVRGFDDLEMQKVVIPSLASGRSVDDVITAINRLRKASRNVSAGRAGVPSSVTLEEDALLRTVLPDEIDKAWNNKYYASRARIVNTPSVSKRTNKLRLNREDLDTLLEETEWTDGTTTRRNIQKALFSGADDGGLYTVIIPPSEAGPIFSNFSAALRDRRMEAIKRMQEVLPGITDQHANSILDAWLRQVSLGVQ